MSDFIHHRGGFIPAIPVVLQLDPLKRLGIIPFQTKPEIIVWENKVFVPVNEDPQDTNYQETSFALADQEGYSTLVRLEVPTGQLITTVRVPSSLPGVVRWGDRIFRKFGGTYREAFFAVAHELATEEEIKAVSEV